jgi:hypothetical protein
VTRNARCEPARVLFLILVLPLFVVAQAFGGSVVWIHAHGDAGAHVHVHSHAHDHEAHDRVTWHASEHGHDTHEQDLPAPDGILLALPELVASTTSCTSLVATIVPPVTFPCAAEDRLGVARTVAILRREWPPPRRQRTGIAALLRTSHAILI